jgi:hypothetical protein
VRALDAASRPSSAPGSLSAAAKAASAAVVSITANKAGSRNAQTQDPWFRFFFGEQAPSEPQVGLGSGVIVGAGAKILGPILVGERAKIGSSAVVVHDVPAGATAVGNPARIIQAAADAQREQAAAKMGFSAYGVTQGDDPVALALQGLIDNATGHEHQIARLWQAIEKLSSGARELPGSDCVPRVAW